MNMELKELSLSDGQEIYKMIVEIGPGENGFGNRGYDIEFKDFSNFLQDNIEMSKGIGLKSEYVSQTMFWLMVNNKPVGIGKLRHYLNEHLREHGGHIGYCIRPSERGKGYGNIILKELLKESKKKGITEVLLTCNEDNVPSRKVIEYSKGILEEVNEGVCKYWIKEF
ncbi:GNAT family N-acetyltransferase [Sporosalibacterium faouarense]|uniref:GNAT family N-acetyltransferase n=1 Tax=Sporosalibacterium faouarense TaxID=516123 RepID=UPI00141D0B5D|nr:GNAT family N-acetyltransferase [Sporosalibacterium faouarense]MTI47939.1 GNAT family N-acetyltransferase [Bacillota bacterium]